MTLSTRESEFAEHWPALAGATTAVGTGAALFSYTTNYFVLPLEAAEGWSRSAIAFGATLYMLGTAAMMPLTGMLADRHGVGRVAPVGLAGYGLLCLALSLLPAHLPVFYTVMLLIALFCSATSGVVFGPFVAARFRRRRGVALSILLSGNAVLLMPLAPVLTAAITDQGWRAGYMILGGLALLLGLPSALFATRGSSARAAAQDAATPRGATIREAMRDPAYWKIILGVVTSTMALGGFLNQLSPLLVSRGIPVPLAASLMSLFVLMVVVGRIAVGALLDAFRPALICMLVMAGAAAGSALLLMETPSPALCALVVVLLGAAMGAEGDLQAFLIAKHFGLTNFAALFGTSAMCTSACLGLGALLFGVLYDGTGSYTAAILIAMALLLLAGLSFGSLGSGERVPQPATGQ